MSESVFVSSSGDLAELRRRISDALASWLRENGFDHIIAPYLWEAEKDNGRLLSDRVSIQEQLVDPASGEVPLTICLFGERCGLPLQDNIPAHWYERLTRWVAHADGPGLLHPWPHTLEAQAEALSSGAFPLTGTVFELLSAHGQDPDADNLVVAYTASRFVEDTTTTSEIDFNDRRLWRRLSAETKSDSEREHLQRHVYNPQKAALLNLLKFLGRRIAPPPCYPSLQELERQVLVRAKEKLRRRLGIVSLRNPFKSTLEHWSIDDRLELPGRGSLVRDLCSIIEKHPETLFLLKGRSGCGKSSLMQRGVLARLRDRGALTVPFRPTDLDDASGSRDRLDVLWQIIADEVGCHDRDVSDPDVKRGRDKRMAEHLGATLERRNIKLVLGLDQFEEILDELNLLRDDKARSRGWWLVLKFFGRLAASPRVMLVATLESSREDTFLALDIEKELKLQRNIIDVDVNADEVAEIAQQGFARGGLPLEADVLEAIKRKWVEFERETAGDVKSASPLPLACLWFAGLYERFEDKARAVRTDDFDAAASTAFEGGRPVLGMADIGRDGIAFEHVIQKLADEAWEAAGLSTFFASPIEEDPKYADLVNFLGPCVGLDVDGHKRLLSIPEVGGDSGTTRLRRTFRNRRLLVPVSNASQGDDTRRARHFRLVHQAVIDRWSPARRVFDARRDYLVLENRFRLDALYWSGRGQAIPVDGPSIIADAAEVLVANRVDWGTGPVDDLAVDVRRLKQQTIAVFLHSETPEAIVRRSRRGLTHAHVAAHYHLVELLERFVAISPNCLRMVCKRGDTLLSVAAWNEGPAVDFLMDHDVPLQAPEAEWSAIEAPIQLGLRKNYDRLIRKIEDVDREIGPNGWRIVHCAGYHGTLFVLEDLKQRDADLCAQDKYKRTALHWAASADRVEAFVYLLGLVPPMLEDGSQDIPLGLAAENGHLDIIRAFLNSDVDDATVAAALTHKNKDGRTPLMLAAQNRRPDALRLLLRECDPRDAVHRTADGATLLHLAMESSARSDPSDDEKVRARKVVQILLEEDGRLDPTVTDGAGRTAFDVALAYEDARRVIRRDERMPRDYHKMTPKMRIDDLTSRKPAVVLDLLRAAPQALTDQHDGKETGLDILVRMKNTQVLATALKELLVTDELLHDKLRSLATLACEASAGPLRVALIGRLNGDAAEAEFLPLLLNASVSARDKEAIAALQGKAAVYLCGASDVGTSIFHSLAIAGRHEDFEQTAAMIVLPLPVDHWGRRPSELAPPEQRRRFREIEERLFSAPHPDQPRTVLPTKLHEYARQGDVKRFERQARGCGTLLPRDAAGKRPSEVAPDERKAEIAALEARYFKEAN